MLQTILRLIVFMLGTFCIFAGIGYLVMNNWIGFYAGMFFIVLGWYLLMVATHCTWSIKEIIKEII